MKQNASYVGKLAFKNEYKGKKPENTLAKCMMMRYNVHVMKRKFDPRATNIRK